MNETIRPGVCRHYKDRFYWVTGVARHSENREEVVLYRCLYVDCFAPWRFLEMVNCLK